MKKRHERTPKPPRVAEPVQVYLDSADLQRLERLAAQLQTNKSEVLRRGLAALESLARRPAKRTGKTASLPTYKGKGLQQGVDLDDMGALLDLMGDASR